MVFRLVRRAGTVSGPPTRVNEEQGEGGPLQLLARQEIWGKSRPVATMKRPCRRWTGRAMCDGVWRHATLLILWYLSFALT